MQSGQFRGILGSLALGIVKIGGDRDNDACQIASQGLFRPFRKHPENLSGNLHRRDRTSHSLDAGHTARRFKKHIRQPAAQGFDLFYTTPDESFC